MKGEIPYDLDWNEGLSIASNVQQISGIILIESNEEEVTVGNKGVDLLIEIYIILKWVIKALALSLSLMAKWLETCLRWGIVDRLVHILLVNLKKAFESGEITLCSLWRLNLRILYAKLVLLSYHLIL